MTVTTTKFAQLLRDAQAWDARHRAMADAQATWMLEHFTIADDLCAYASPIDRQRWHIPRVADGHLYTVCETTR
jgi:hypothetical protein